jgi:uncharacterized protein
MNMIDFIKKHSAVFYFLITFIVSWGSILLIVGFKGIPASPKELNLLLPIVVMAMVLGPVVSGILMTGIVYGKSGFRNFLSRLLTWKVNIFWYIVALLMVPFLIMAILFLLSIISPTFIPTVFVSNNKMSILLPGLLAGLVAGLFEETGWTGFVIPRLRLRYSVFLTGIIVGFLWGAWHFLVAFWGSGTSSKLISLDLFLPQMMFYVAILPVYRILMVWVYDRTKSLLVSMIMHASLTANTTFILVPVMTRTYFLTYYLILSIVLWIIVAIIARFDSKHFK